MTPNLRRSVSRSIRLVTGTRMRGSIVMGLPRKGMVAPSGDGVRCKIGPPVATLEPGCPVRARPAECGAMLEQAHEPPRALHVPPPAWILVGAISTQAASALAVHAFRSVGPVGIAWGRIVFAAAVLVLATGVARLRPARSSLPLVGLFGV